MYGTQPSPCSQATSLSAQSWPTVVEGMLEPLYRFVQARVPTEGVDDLVQETFMAASRAIGRFDGRSSIWTWLTVIARHKIADFYRVKGGRSVLEVALDSLDSEGDVVEYALAGETPLPDEICERREFQMLARVAASALCPEYQTCLIARYDEDLSLEDMAARLGISKAAANTRLHRARQELRAAFLRLVRGGSEWEQESVP